ncbi:hypothetical protein [Streptomyces chartreusis]
MDKSELKRTFDEADARAIWEEMTRKITERGWYLSVGDHTVSICIPGDGGTDRYVEVIGDG